MDVWRSHCSAREAPSGGVFVLYADGATSSLNGLDMQILAINDGTATLRISLT
jgi:hypothetical protein